jgi:hypothetical protein
MYKDPMEARWKERDAKYEELKKRAEESGVMLPDIPPWREREAMRDPRPDHAARMERMKKMHSMTPEERDAIRMERYQEMRERAAEKGMELPETPRWKLREDEWAKHQEVLKGMTDEERAACHAMHRRHMREMGPGQMRGMRPPMPPRGYGQGYYGPGPMGDFWNPEQ